MFERFSDRARKVMALANQEAQRFNHEYIGTEHLLLGLVKEGTGVGVTALRKHGVDTAMLRGEVEKLVRNGPHVVPEGKRPQTPRAKRVIEYAIEEAKAFDHDYVGTEHILLGLFRETEGIGAQVLTNLGLTVEDTRRTIASLLETGAACEPLQPCGMGAISQQQEADYHNLAVWRIADKLAHAVYRVTGGFPKEETYGVASHLRRTALLLPPNVATAYRQPDKAQAQWFVDITLGLLQELRYGLDFSATLEYLRIEEHEELASLATEIDKELRDFHAELT